MELSPPRSSDVPRARILLAVVAAVMVAWFGLMLRNYHVGMEAADELFLHPDMSHAAWAHQIDRLREAHTLDPSTDWAVTRANYLVLRDKAAAQSTAESVVRQEPDNLAAWSSIAVAARGRDPVALRRAYAAIRRLNPSASAPR